MTIQFRLERLQLAEGILSRAIDQRTRTVQTARQAAISVPVELSVTEARGIAELLRDLLGDQEVRAALAKGKAS